VGGECRVDDGLSVWRQLSGVLGQLAAPDQGIRSSVCMSSYL
jgi:hypothetical protein